MVLLMNPTTDDRPNVSVADALAAAGVVLQEDLAWPPQWHIRWVTCDAVDIPNDRDYLTAAEADIFYAAQQDKDRRDAQARWYGSTRFD